MTDQSTAWHPLEAIIARFTLAMLCAMLAGITGPGELSSLPPLLFAIFWITRAFVLLMGQFRRVTGTVIAERDQDSNG